MTTGEIILSALTAFIIGAGGSLLVVFASNGQAGLNDTALIASVVLGAVTAAKDVRSLLKLPPVSATDEEINNSKKP